MKEINNETLRNDLLSMISDDYKSLNGMRPRWNMDHLSNEQLQEWHNEIRADIKREMDQERADELAHEQAVSAAMTPTTGFILGDLFKNFNSMGGNSQLTFKTS